MALRGKGVLVLAADAIALGDDLGGFDHNEQTFRVLTSLERRYAEFDGLNLTWEMLEGLAKHNGPLRRPSPYIADYDRLHPLDLTTHASAEAQVAAIADDIAYDNHDIDDGIRAGLLTLEQLLEMPFVARRWDMIRTNYPDVPERRLIGELTRSQIGWMVNDVIEATRVRIAQNHIETATDVRSAAEALGGFSEEVAAQERTLKKFMYANLYHHAEQLEAALRARKIVTELFASYREDAALLPQEWRDSLPVDEPGHSRHIADFLAGMTDRYAMNRHREIYGAVS